MNELKAIQGIINGQQFELYFKSEADKFIADLEESHKMEVEQLLIEIAEKDAEIARALAHRRRVRLCPEHTAHEKVA